MKAKAVASRPASTKSAREKPCGAAPTPWAALESAAPWTRKHACACGGGCPRCRGKLATRARPRISQPDDPLEREAERTAERLLDPRAREVAELAGKAQGEVLRRPVAPPSAFAGAAPPIVRGALGSPSQALDPATRAFFEPRLGRDLSAVRVHTGDESALAARAIRAHAFTLGNDIVFDHGAFRPDTAAGRRLLAHELAHVAQQDSPDGARAARTLLRTSYSDCHTDQQTHLEVVVTQARDDLRVAIELLGRRPMTRQVSDALWLMFRDRSEHRARFARGYLQSIYDRLPGAWIECEQPDDFGYGFMCSEHVGGYVRLSGVITTLGSIHLCMGEWDVKPELEQEHMVLHEAAHMFVHADDLGYFNIADCMETDESAAAAATTEVPGVRANNADCYACLVRLLARMSEQQVAERLGQYEGDTLRLRQSPPGPIDLGASEGSTVFTISIPDPADPERSSVPEVFQFRWVLWDPERNEYPLQDLFGREDAREYGRHGTVILPASTRVTLRARSVTRGTVYCRYMMTGMGHRLYWLPVEFRRGAAPATDGR